MYDYQLEHIFSYSVTLVQPPEVIGPVGEGIRANFYVAGGEVTGPKVHGRVLPVGGDWLTVRHDGVAILDVRATIETNDGALILVTYPGVSDIGPDGYQRFLEQNLPPIIPLKTVPRFATAHPAYEWLNRCLCLGIGQADLGKSLVSYDIYAVR